MDKAQTYVLRSVEVVRGRSDCAITDVIDAMQRGVRLCMACAASQRTSLCVCVNVSVQVTKKKMKEEKKNTKKDN